MDSDDSDGDAAAFQLLVLLVLTLVNAFFAGAEMAVVSVDKGRIRERARCGDRRACLLEHLFEDSTKFLSTIQVAITLAGFFSSASAATGISQILADWLESCRVPAGETLAVAAVTILLSYVTLVFGELVPKRLAMQRAEQFSLWTVWPIYILSKLLTPFIWLLSVPTNRLLRLFGIREGGHVAPEGERSSDKIVAPSR